MTDPELKRCDECIANDSSARFRLSIADGQVIVTCGTCGEEPHHGGGDVLQMDEISASVVWVSECSDPGATHLNGPCDHDSYLVISLPGVEG